MNTILRKALFITSVCLITLPVFSMEEKKNETVSFSAPDQKENLSTSFSVEEEENSEEEYDNTESINLFEKIVALKKTFSEILVELKTWDQAYYETFLHNRSKITQAHKCAQTLIGMWGDEDHSRALMEIGKTVLKDGVELDRQAREHLYDPKLYISQAKDGDAEAQYRLSFLYTHGPQKNYRKSVKFLRRAARQMHDEARRSLIHSYNADVPEIWGPQEAEEAKTQYNLGFMLYIGQAVKEDKSLAQNKFARLALRGYLPAQHVLGTLLYEKEALYQAFVWFREAAQQGYAPAQHCLSVMYFHNQAFKKIKDLSSWTTEVGYLPTAYLLDTPISPETSRDKTLNWLKKAAQQEYPPSMIKLEELLHENSTITMKIDPIDTQAIEQDNNYLYELGIKYIEQKNFAVAFEILKRSATNGYAPAQYKLGILHFKGQGTDRNPEEAYQWFSRAATQGNSCAQLVLDTFFRPFS